jgi:glutathione S-transferase
MDSFAVEEARQRLARWIEDGHSVLGVVPWLFEENDRLCAMTTAAERESARLKEELDALRAETDFLIGEREEIAEMIAAGLNKVMNEALQRLRAPFGSRATQTMPDTILQPEPTYS